MKLYLKCASPIHIGTGNVLEPFDYVFHAEKVIKLNLDACLARIYETNPQGIEHYSGWVNRTSQEIASAKDQFNKARKVKDHKGRKQYNQILSDLRKNFNLINFCEKELNDASLAAELLTDPKFHKQSMYALNRPGGTRQLREMMHINGKPYIPGSSLKGALRTALAYRALKNLNNVQIEILLSGKQGTNIRGIGAILKRIRKMSEDAIHAIESHQFGNIKEALEKIKKERKKWQRNIGEEIEKVVFGCGDEKKGKILYDDPKFDLLKLLHISDTTDIEFELMAGELKSFTRDGRSGELKSQPIQYCEFLDEGSQFTFDMHFDYSQLSAILNNKLKGWIGIKEKFDGVFQIPLNGNTDNLENKMLESIQDAIRQFSNAIIKKETDWLNRFKPQEVGKIQSFYQQLNSKQPPLRIGFSSGWHSTTVGLALAEHPGLSDYLPELIYAFNLDLIRNQEKLLQKAQRNPKKVQAQLRLLKRQSSPQRFPGSRRLIADRRKPYAPVGWIILSDRLFPESKQKSTSKTSEKKTTGPEPGENFESKLEQLKNKFNQ